MRYIGSGFGPSDVQIDPDRNTFLNVNSFGAVNLDRYFSGTVVDLRSNGSIIDISNIQDFNKYLEYFKEGNEITVFFTNSSTNPGSGYLSLITNPQTTLVGKGISSNLASAQYIKYFIYAYNPFTGKFSPYQVTTTTSFKTIQDPDFIFDSENYVQLSISRNSSEIIPVIFRKWGTDPIKFLGTPGNSIFGSDTTIVFNDRGLSQITPWDRDLLSLGKGLPSFLKGSLSYSSNAINATTIIEKRRLKITNVYVNSETVEFQDAETDGATFSEDLVTSSARFLFNSTAAIQKSIEAAATGAIKEIFIPSGTYYIENVSLFKEDNPSYYSGITIRGAGDSTVLKRMPSHVNAVNNYGLLEIRGASNNDAISMITVKSLAIDGNKFDVFTTVSPQGDLYGISDKNNDFIYIDKADSVRINDCSLYNGIGAGITATDVSRINVTNNRVFNLSKPYELNVSPIRFREVSKAVVQGNLFEETSGPVDGIGVSGSTINNNIINNCGGTGILLNSSENWSAENNLSLSDNGSLIRSVDLYNNEYSRVSIDVKRGSPLPTTYFTVTDNGLPVKISKETINAPIYQLNSDYQRGGSALGYFQVLESKQQMEAGIFALSLPTITKTESTNVDTSNKGKKILGTQDFSLLKTTGTNPIYGYAYTITAAVAVGQFLIDRIKFESAGKLRIQLKNSADLLKINYLSVGGSINDGIMTSNIGVSGSVLQNWPDDVTIDVDSVNYEDSSIIISTPTGVSDKFLSSENNFRIVGGTFGVVKQNYFIADGNIYVSE